MVSSLPVGKRRRLPGLAVRPGAIRQARHEAGLSLGQVASGEVSRTAVFLAETGKTRPTLPTIKLIAARTGKPVEYFLESAEDLASAAERPDLDALRSLAAAERFDDLLAAAAAAKTRAIAPLDRAWAGFYLALAQIRRQVSARPALAELEACRIAFEAAGDRWMVVECMDWQSAALNLLEDRSALEMAESALEACRLLSPPNRSLEARILGRLGSIHVSRRQWAQAVDHYTQAVEVAGELRDLSRVGKMYNDLGIAYEHMGDLARSRVFSQKAITIHELLNDRLSVARAENNLGLVLMRQGHLDLAREHLKRSLDLCEEIGIEVVKSSVLLSLAELDLNGNDPNGARRHLDAAIDIAERSHEFAALGEGHELLGRLAESLGDEATADHEYNFAAATFQKAGMNVKLVSCRVAYAHVLEQRGDTVGALDQMRRALRVTRPDLAMETSVPGAEAETA